MFFRGAVLGLRFVPGFSCRGVVLAWWGVPREFLLLSQKKVAGPENLVQSSGSASQCACLGKVFQEGFGCFQGILLANVEEFQFFRQYTFYAYLVAMPEIEVHDGEFAGVCLEYWREGVRPHGVYAGEGVHLAVFDVEIFVWAPDFAGGSVRPPYELHLLVEK